MARWVAQPQPSPNVAALGELEVPTPHAGLLVPPQVEAQVVVCGTRWHPVSMTNQVCSDVESWQFEEWSDWAAAPVARWAAKLIRVCL